MSMKSLIFRLLSLVSLAATCLAGCGGSDEGSNAVGNATGADETFVSLCEDTADIDTWTQAPISRDGENYSLRLMAISPEPWSVGDNDWRIEVKDKEGAIVDGASLFVTPYMPDHGHGVSPPNYDGIQASDGLYDIDTFNLMMPGFWEMTVTVGAVDVPTEVIAFRICVES